MPFPRGFVVAPTLFLRARALGGGGVPRGDWWGRVNRQTTGGRKKKKQAATVAAAAAISPIAVNAAKRQANSKNKTAKNQKKKKVGGAGADKNSSKLTPFSPDQNLKISFTNNNPGVTAASASRRGGSRGDLSSPPPTYVFGAASNNNSSRYSRPRRTPTPVASSGGTRQKRGTPTSFLSPTFHPTSPPAAAPLFNNGLSSNGLSNNGLAGGVSGRTVFGAGLAATDGHGRRNGRGPKDVRRTQQGVVDRVVSVSFGGGGGGTLFAFCGVRGVQLFARGGLGGPFICYCGSATRRFL